MAVSKSEVVLSFYGDIGQVVGKMRIVAMKKNTLWELNESESNEFQEEPIQILEGNTYEYVIIESPSKATLRLGQTVTKSKLSNQGQGEQGRIEPGLFTGRMPIVLENETGKPLGRAYIEVRSYKVDYRDDYREMMNYISNKCTDLLLEVNSPSEVRLTPDPGKDSETIYQRFVFLKSIIKSNNFLDALEQIVRSPHEKLFMKDEKVSINKGLKPNANALKQIARGYPRIRLNESHPLFHPLKNQYNSEVTLPVTITSTKKQQSFDTTENRFIKYILQDFQSFFELMKNRLKVKKLKKDRFILNELDEIIDLLNEVLKKRFFTDIGDMQFVPISSPVLQKKSGYREVFQAWLKFQLASKLIWVGGEDVYSGGKRDVAILYEYWVFFSLLDLVENLFTMDVPPVKKLIEKTSSGLGLKLKSGNHLAIKGSFAEFGRKLSIEFSYNRTFSRKGKDGQFNYPLSGSWTYRMRPDYSLSIWPEAFTQEEAEEQELMVHIHFDAKYRADNLLNLFGSNSEEDVAAEKEAQRKSGIYKRADLLKMHAYKDAIRRTVGAYIIYPGDQNRTWSGFHEILPGVGAFVLRPGRKDKDLCEISNLIRKILEHLSNRVNKYEKSTYHLYNVYKNNGEANNVHMHLPEKDSLTNNRVVLPDQHSIIISSYKGKTQLDWINKFGMFNCYLGDISTAFTFPQELMNAEHLLLFNEEGLTNTGFWKVLKEAPRIYSTAQLEDIGLRLEDKGENDIYAVFKVERDFSYDSVRIHKRDLHLPSGFISPYIIKLSDLVNMGK
ncbi:DUF2357 domain-containing protein [Peribacillus frigoritolerans]|uniref:DUF2357 domain-containing protein n=1 Tax=Peribacillus frigoritolerans TaxID=450367 RepID=UPI002E1D7E03|nr:DUF2357 domain-containing protein [Peribacillus frigoritolerans]